MENTTSLSQEEIGFVQAKLEDSIKELQKRIAGMKDSMEAILLTILARGHVLLEGMPGLAKTMLAKSIAEIMDSPFQRIQFTPDLLPADLTGTIVFNPKTASFDTRKGPVFTGILLADEINRAPAKVQAALLQCMEERAVSLGDTTHELDKHFFVIATQNPIDQEGTYNLPEAQMDRFLIKLNISYPDMEEELQILERHANKDEASLDLVIHSEEKEKLCKTQESVFVDRRLKEYIVNIVRETRPESAQSQQARNYIRHGASPRASLALLRMARGRALLLGRGYVIPEDIQHYAKEILRHRILLKYEAMAEEIDADTLVESLLDFVKVP